MEEKLKFSKETLNKAIKDYKPQAIVCMFSGGDDSLTAYHVSKELGISFDFVIHGNTRTGIPKTFDFVQKEIERNNDKLLVADAGDAYEKYVRRKGFFGKGIQAHTFSYHILKKEHFEKTVSRYIRKRQRNFPILFINGGRRQESTNRMITMKEAIKVPKGKKNDIWVNVINEWTNHDCKEYLNDRGIKRAPVSVELCKSGECMCGTMQTHEERREASFLFPEWGKWLDNLEKEVMQKFPWRWGEGINKQHLAEKNGQTNFLKDSFQPMCQDCKGNLED